MEYNNQLSTEMQTGERGSYGFTPDEKETISETYTVLTKLIILGGEMHNTDLILAAENLQEIIDEL